MSPRPPDTPLRRADLAPDPIEQFQLWFDRARETSTMPEAMTLCTASADGAPSGRMVLMKGVSALGFDFYTNYSSRKGAQLAANPRAALVFWWVELDRQVRVEGEVARLDASTSDGYFATRPRGARIGAIASRQTAVVERRAELESAVARVERETAAGEVERPEHWGGFRLVPNAIEFWQGRHDRLHDRFVYTRRPGGDWEIERLQP